MKIIEKIQDWYLQQCNGDWEHSYGVKIETMDNPGWLVKIDLIETDLENTGLSEKDERTESDWVHFQVKDKQFIGSGGSQNLEEILKRFIDWSKE